MSNCQSHLVWLRIALAAEVELFLYLCCSHITGMITRPSYAMSIQPSASRYLPGLVRVRIIDASSQDVLPEILNPSQIYRTLVSNASPSMQTAICRSSVTDSLEAVGVPSRQAHVMDVVWTPRGDLRDVETRITTDVGTKILIASSASTAAVNAAAAEIRADMRANASETQTKVDALRTDIAAQTAALLAQTAATQAKIDSNSSETNSYMFMYALLGFLAMFLVPLWTKHITGT